MAQATHISEPKVLYYLRGELRGYTDEKFKWTEDTLSPHREQEALDMIALIKDLAWRKKIDFKSLDLSVMDLYKLSLVKNNRQDWESII
ncbi:MAG: hypothetical protein NTZ48_00500, partial [Candidatus Omnitrophica bacterium]|nr:hypothetical protein [Candidatus Omnitrophota bacterium]